VIFLIRRGKKLNETLGIKGDMSSFQNEWWIRLFSARRGRRKRVEKDD